MKKPIYTHEFNELRAHGLARLEELLWEEDHTLIRHLFKDTLDAAYKLGRKKTPLTKTPK